MNQVFLSDFRLEGICFGKSYLIGKQGDLPCFIVSQPWIRAANPAQPHPSKREIKEFMESLGFIERTDLYYGWHRTDDGIIVIDARPDNFIKTVDGVVPIDLVIQQID
jgi:hypothetical protein